MGLLNFCKKSAKFTKDIGKMKKQTIDKNTERKADKKVKRMIMTVLAFSGIAAALLLSFTLRWIFVTWPNLSMDELVFTINSPLEGTGNGMIVDYCKQCIVPTVIIFVCLLIVRILVCKFYKKMQKVEGIALLVSAIVFAVFGGIAWKRLDIGDYLASNGQYSEFIDDNYVDPSTVELTFPEKKRNLIYIYLESMEMTYSDKENGGAYDDNYIPNLTKLSQENENFSGSSTKLNGGYSMPGTTWTIGAMFAQTSGLPLNTSLGANAMSTQNTFFPGIMTLGDILEAEDYKQIFMIGSNAAFGGRDIYFEEHGDYEIDDYWYAASEGLIPEDYYVWWGYEDQKLFEYAKDKLLELAQDEEPFNLTLLTVDTHFEDGYVCDLCDDAYGDDQYANVISCSDRQVTEFVEWIQQQDFYKNTTIVISGDHPTMDSDFCENIDESYNRRVYTAYINAMAEANGTERTYSTFDAFPTTLAALGVQIDGERLGLGTNLFSDVPTLLETYGYDFVSAQLKKRSKLVDDLAGIDDDFTGLYLDGDIWCQFTNGERDYEYIGLSNNDLGWWYVKDGEVDFSFNGIAENEDGWWYLEDGKVQFEYNGWITDSGKKYYVENGKVQKDD